MAVPLLAATVLMSAGCAEVGHEPSVVVRDSAGIMMVTNPDAELPEWLIDSLPSVTIGSVEGGEGQDLALPWSSLRLTDGRIAISNARTNELRLYSPTGEYLRSVGGPGEGPGEFGLIARLSLGLGDTIVAADATQLRLNLFASTGDFGRTITLGPPEGRLPRLRGLLSDTIGVYRTIYYGRSGGRSAAVRDTFLLFARSLDHGLTRTIGRFPAEERFNQVLPNGAVAGWNLPFGRALHTAISDTIAWVGVSDSWEIQGYDADGTLKIVVRLDRALAEVGVEEQSRFREHQLAGVEDPDQLHMYRELHEVLEFSSKLPAFSDLRIDKSGNLWVQEYRVPWSEEDPLWRIFDPGGRAIAVARTPRDLIVHDIGEDYVLGLEQDDMGVEYIRSYRLRRSSD